ncbi:colicin transporter [Bifidobacterium longum subsp. suis]|nr:colicin transporter [Bifidobacterium longum]MBL3899784.1 colicin transporter [Bifidobacterium longum subsp. suis]
MKLGVKKLTAIIIAAVAVALAGIGGGYAYWTHHETNAYHEAVAQAENADKALMKTVDEATATTYKADQLKEPKLLDKLDAAISKAKALKGIPNDAPSEWLAWQLASAKKANATDADEANAQVKTLNAALKAVSDSKLAKELDGAKDQLKQGIDSASKTFKDTDGKVADNATRDSLKKAIDEANSALSKKGVTDPKTYTDAKAKLDAAVKQVNDSKAAKDKADADAAAQAQAAQAQEQAAQAAAQAQAAAAAAQPQSSYAQSYNRYGGFGSGYSAPQQSYTAPQQSYTPSNNGGGSSSGPTITGGGIAFGCTPSEPGCGQHGAPDAY